ncbi:unnamed protein product [Dovyalis caffra]|uniref:Uncharacterized protein n=1 Tax=Dovyalis caffra TaxID=77055 RepID=A0AAV1RG87_9ROSI|nr:unnamed protein product [Dovyalis caffra]
MLVIHVVPTDDKFVSFEMSGTTISQGLSSCGTRVSSVCVGVGINVRNKERYFLSTFTIVYSMRPSSLGVIQGQTKCLFAQEFIRRLDAEEIEIVFGNAEEKSEQGSSLFSKAARVFRSLDRFMRAISK